MRPFKNDQHLFDPDLIIQAIGQPSGLKVDIFLLLFLTNININMNTRSSTWFWKQLVGNESRNSSIGNLFFHLPTLKLCYW